jgi:phosphatidylinositol-3-phosphatase
LRDGFSAETEVDAGALTRSRISSLLASAVFRAVLLVAVALTAAGCGGSSSSAAAPRVAVLLLENKEYGQIIGNPDLPYINSLANRYALATSYYGIRHPSLPNYIAVTSGSTAGITSDCVHCRVKGLNLVDQLETAGASWKAYLEGVPSRCYKGGDTGLYVKRHNPFAYYNDIVGSRSRCKKMVPLTYLTRDIRTGDLPRFIWITPNLCHDMHDCDPVKGDTFLSRLLPPLLAKLGPKGVLFLTFDEGTTDAGCCKKARGGHVMTIAAGPGARRGVKSAVPYDHYSLLRTIEERFRLHKLGNAGCACTRSMKDLILPRK